MIGWLVGWLHRWVRRWGRGSWTLGSRGICLQGPALADSLDDGVYGSEADIRIEMPPVRSITDTISHFLRVLRRGILFEVSRPVSYDRETLLTDGICFGASAARVMTSVAWSAGSAVMEWSGRRGWSCRTE